MIRPVEPKNEGKWSQQCWQGNKIEALLICIYTQSILQRLQNSFIHQWQSLMWLNMNNDDDNSQWRCCSQQNNIKKVITVAKEWLIIIYFSKIKFPFLARAGDRKQETPIINRIYFEYIWWEPI